MFDVGFVFSYCIAFDFPAQYWHFRLVSHMQWLLTLPRNLFGLSQKGVVYDESKECLHRRLPMQH